MSLRYYVFCTFYDSAVLVMSWQLKLSSQVVVSKSLILKFQNPTIKNFLLL